ncbi:MAG: hypothetical protein QOF41_2197 [Methylobacteriaceae bacterium]|nr:hypothetical protein [Methylobacteriaceae bacterium]
MSDPVTIGGLAALALSMGAQAALKGVVGEAAKTAYNTLKAKVSAWAGSDVQALEKTPGSKARQDVVAEAIDQQPPDDQQGVRELAKVLLDQLERVQSSTPVGIDIGKLKAARVKLGEIDVSKGIGVRMGEVETAGDFETSKVTVGQNQPGKSQR